MPDTSSILNIQEMKHPMYTSSSICHQFKVEISLGKLTEMSSTLKGEYTWKI